MNIIKKLMGITLALALALGTFTCFAPAAQAEGMDEFVFTGASTAFGDGTELHFMLEGYDDGTLSLTIDEYMMMEIVGTYQYVENKGYKFYFEDSASSVVYTYYDAAAKTFSCTYNIYLGTDLGAGKVTLTSENEAFAAVYDGEGLGAEPPVFEGCGYGGGAGRTMLPVQLHCYEDGTCRVVFVGSNEVYATHRTGKYTYDEATNVYHFDFDYEEYPSAYIRDFDDDGGLEYKYYTGVIYQDEEGRNISEYEIWEAAEGERELCPSAETTYDEATNTYTLNFVAVSLNYIGFTTTYTPAE